MLSVPCQLANNLLRCYFNSGFGATGNPYFRFYDVRVAEAITVTGQLVTKWISKEINQFLWATMPKVFKTGKDYVLYIDTDSVILDVNPLVQKLTEKDEQKIVDFLSTFAEKLQKAVIGPQNERLQKLTNCTHNYMDLKREGIASSGFWKAKKLYAMRVLDSEGVRKEYLKIMGLEAAKSTIPAAIRKEFEEVYGKILRGASEQTIKAHLESVRKKFLEADPMQIAKGISVSGLAKYSDTRGNPISGATQQAIAALVYNAAALAYNKHARSKLELIREGEKIKLVVLQLPNPLKSKVIAFKDRFPSELIDEKYINRQEMFFTLFESPLRDLCSTFGWNINPEVNSLEGFFV